jgi:hypothetical protein
VSGGDQYNEEIILNISEFFCEGLVDGNLERN